MHRIRIIETVSPQSTQLSWQMGKKSRWQRLFHSVHRQSEGGLGLGQLLCEKQRSVPWVSKSAMFFQTLRDETPLWAFIHHHTMFLLNTCSYERDSHQLPSPKGRVHRMCKQGHFGLPFPELWGKRLLPLLQSGSLVKPLSPSSAARKDLV